MIVLYSMWTVTEYNLFSSKGFSHIEFTFIEYFLQAMRVSDGLDAGTCFVNTYNKTDVAAPFGGFKQSGFGKDLGKCEHTFEMIAYVHEP